ncbi:hypothetical protein KP509_15G001200 [Ceratopteris richardii]|uniref:C2H2-type domain-containing protein n=1 Tax=Ceratopteris richardii TaxID=49495 RepID=A0A8T2T476_CERRI|nr:hypothetical protein KP509_15G001200 [Ceratopteris richardii]
METGGQQPPHNDAPVSALSFFDMATGGHHDASSCSTAASEQSERKKRPSPSYDDEANFKPYECRFCPMKFAKSQALGGHMNRHRQEREREQLMNARQLLMQQEFSSTLMMSGQNAQSSLSKLGQSHLQRPTNENPMKDGLRLSSGPPMMGSMGRGFLQSNPFNPSLPPSSLNWNLGNAALDTAANHQLPAFNMDGTIRSYQARQAYTSTSPMNNNNTSLFLMQPSLKCSLSQNDLIGATAAPYEKAMPMSMCSYDSDNPALHRSNSCGLLHASQPSQPQDGSILTGSPDESANFMPGTTKSYIHEHHNGIKLEQQVSQGVPNANMETGNSGFQLMTYPTTESQRSHLSSHHHASEFNLSSTNPLDGNLSWLQKDAVALNALSSPNVDYNTDIENAEPKIDHQNVTGPGHRKALKWDLSLPSSDSVPPDNKMGDLTSVVAEGSVLSFEDHYAHTAGALDGQTK